MDFVALDIETSNSDLTSICQIGIAKFVGGHFVEGWITYVNPQSWFGNRHTKIHGIAKKDIAKAPTFKQISNQLRARLSGMPVVTHAHFDRLAIDGACKKFGVPIIDCRWYDSSIVVRRSWKKFSRFGFGLANASREIGYKFSHHDALEDAKAAGHIVVAASVKTGKSIETLLSQAEHKIKKKKESPTKDRNPKSPPGKTITFTGTLSVDRESLLCLVEKAGYEIAPNVTATTEVLCVGKYNEAHIPAGQKSTKHKKAEHLISEGHSIRIVTESEFLKMTANGKNIHPF
ncbi:exonuclease domain-containing protein [Hyphococcus lacteus]|uniref:Exonuclease domain-containing protein n=1 Tax=Hyphococcus lacteus TaxID=3143536 RepID=A0ABV3Z087_9PROT